MPNKLKYWISQGLPLVTTELLIKFHILFKFSEVPGFRIYDEVKNNP